MLSQRIQQAYMFYFIFFLHAVFKILEIINYFNSKVTILYFKNSFALIYLKKKSKFYNQYFNLFQCFN